MKSFIVTCPKCKGDGKDSKSIGFHPPCRKCGGSGKIRKG